MPTLIKMPTTQNLCILTIQCISVSSCQQKYYCDYIQIFMCFIINSCTKWQAGDLSSIFFTVFYIFSAKMQKKSKI